VTLVYIIIKIIANIVTTHSSKNSNSNNNNNNKLVANFDHSFIEKKKILPNFGISVTIFMILLPLKKKRLNITFKNLHLIQTCNVTL
jgi:hypothetical protein